MDALDAILTRRSTRNYRPDAVEPDKLRRVIDAGRHAPSGGNNQTNHFIVVQDAQVRATLASLAETAFAAMEITDGMYPSLRRSIELSRRGGYRFHFDAPVLIIVANRRDYGNNMADCAVAIENMMIAANALDLGSCWLNQLKWLNEDPALLSYLRSLGMKDDERVYASMALGYAATQDRLPARNPLARKGNEVTYI